MNGRARLNVIETGRDYGSIRSAESPANRPFHEGLKLGEVRLMACGCCGAGPWLPWAGACRYCLEDRDISWVCASGEATVTSYTTVHRQYVEQFSPPYVVALIELVEGPRIAGEVLGSCEGLAVGSMAQLVIASGSNGTRTPAILCSDSDLERS